MWKVQSIDVQLLQVQIFACNFQQPFIHFVGKIYKSPETILLLFCQFQKQFKKVSFRLHEFLMANPIIFV